MIHIITELQGIGIVEYLTLDGELEVKMPQERPQEPSAFFLEYVTSRNSGPGTIVQKAKSSYPTGMLPSDRNLYVHVNGVVIEASTKKPKPFETLEDFVAFVEVAGKEGTGVVSFSERDFDASSLMVERRRFWGIREVLYSGMAYKMHTYDASARRAPPKYQRIQYHKISPTR